MELLAVKSGLARAWLLGCCALLACGTPRSLARADEPPPAVPVRFEPLWRQDIGRRLGASLSAEQGRVAAATLDRRVAAIDLESGKRIWRKKRAAGIQAGVTLTGGRVLGVCDFPHGGLFCLDARTGEEQWQLDTGDAWGAPLVRGPHVWSASSFGEVVCCSLATGGLLWRAELDRLVRAPLGLIDTLLLIPTVEAQLIALDAATGEERWRSEIGGALYGRPTPAAGLVWSVSYVGVLCGVDPATGAVLERQELEGLYRCGVVSSGDTLIALSAGGRVTALHAATGEVLWEQALEAASDIPPVLAARLVWVSLSNGSVKALSMGTGRVAAELTLPDGAATGVLVRPPYLVVGTVRGDVLAFHWPDLTPLLRDDPRTVGASRPAPGWPDALKADRRHLATRGSSFEFSLGAPAQSPSSEPGFLASTTMTSGPVILGEKPKDSRLKSGRWWAAGWILGTATAMWLQYEANQAYEVYVNTGNAARRDAALNQAERYDRYATGVWITSEVFFLLALRAWLKGG